MGHVVPAPASPGLSELDGAVEQLYDDGIGVRAQAAEVLSGLFCDTRNVEVREASAFENPNLFLSLLGWH